MYELKMFFIRGLQRKLKTNVSSLDVKQQFAPRNVKQAKEA
jgi:hypothetical protein